MSKKTNTEDMRGHNLPKADVHAEYLKKLLVIEQDKQSQAAKNRAGMKRFKDEEEEVLKSARLAGVSVKALKHTFKVENFLQKNVKAAASDRIDNDILDESKAIMEQLGLFAPNDLGVYPSETEAELAQKRKDEEKARGKAADAKVFDADEAKKKSSPKTVN